LVALANQALEKLRHARLKERLASQACPAVVLTQRAKSLVPRCAAVWQVEAGWQFYAASVPEHFPTMSS
jgi:hypothetical protein